MYGKSLPNACFLFKRLCIYIYVFPRAAIRFDLYCKSDLVEGFATHPGMQARQRYSNPARG